MTDPTVILVGGIALVVAAALVGRRSGVPTPLLLLAVGIAIGFVPAVPAVTVPSELILTGVLPPLLYASAVTVPVRDFRRNLRPIAGLAVVLVIVTTLLAGLVVKLLLPDLDLALAIALGAVVAPTDAVAATSIAKKLGLPDRLVTVLEGESLVNDATALVLLRTAVAATAGAVSAWGVVGSFAWSVVGGILVGVVVGFGASLVRSRLGDPVLTTAVSFAVPFVAFVPAEHAGASGVLAVVVAGLAVGHRASGLDAQQRVAERMNWRTLQFLLEQGVFLVMGLQLFGLLQAVDADDATGPGLGRALLVAVVLVALLLVLRAFFVAGMLVYLRWVERRAIARGEHLGEFQERLDAMDTSDPRVARRKVSAQRRVEQYGADLEFLRQEGLGRSGGQVLAWAGMRGVVTLAAAQSLEDGPRELLIVIAFTVSAITLVGFGGTLGIVIRRSGVQRDDSQALRQEASELALRLRNASLAVLDDPEQLLVHGERVDEKVVELLRERYRWRATQAAADGRAASGSAADGDAEADGEPDDAAAVLAAEDLDVRRMTLREQALLVEQRMRAAARTELLDVASVGTYSSRTTSAAQDLLDLEDFRSDRMSGS